MNELFKLTSKHINKYPKSISLLITHIYENINKDNIVIGIDGRCAAGKTTLSVKLKDIFDCNVIHTDDFFLPCELRTEERLDQPGGNIHYERFFDEVVKGIKSKSPIKYGVFDCASMSFVRTEIVQPKPITVIEGAYSLHPFFENLYDIKVFYDIDPIEQKNRIIKRNGLEAYKMFQTKWIPMEEKYISFYHIESICDFYLHATSDFLS